jgi:hypothetical protein
MTIKPLLTALALVLAVPAQAGWFDALQGNDTGGIIPWSPGIEQVAMERAGAHCATYNKVAAITSVHRVYGDYIGFICAFPRGYDPVKDRAIQWSVAR